MQCPEGETVGLAKRKNFATKRFIYYFKITKFMKEKIIISGFCPEIARGGAFDLEKILEISPRVLTSDEKPHYIDSSRTEVGNVTGIKQGYLFRNSYSLKTSGGNVPLKFSRRDAKDVNDSRTPRVILSLPDNYFFGKEMVEQYK